VRFPDRLPQAIFGFRNSNQMDMIRHQAIRPDRDVTPAAPLGHQGQVGPVIFVMEEGLHSSIPALGDMVGNTRGYEACYSWHGGTLHQTEVVGKGKIGKVSLYFLLYFLTRSSD
jgi:hypothetical protein